MIRLIHLWALRAQKADFLVIVRQEDDTRPRHTDGGR
jgi:rhodanese-related sulfurtransferase